MIEAMPSPLPDYECPPLDEVIIGVQFDPLPNLHAAHLGLFWSRVRDRYPATDNQPPLMPQFEPPDVRPAVESVTIGPMPFVPRVWFIDKSKNNLIQLQRDRFIRNWRRLEGNEPYPRFECLIGEFKRDWQVFGSFVKEERLGEVGVTQCELTYTNHFDKGSGWESLADAAGVFTVLQTPRLGSFLPPPELFTWEAKFRMPENKGRLIAEIKPVFRSRDLAIAVQFQLTARGAPAGKAEDQMFSWFETAHEWIVRGFDQLTTPAMHTLWKKKGETCQ